MSTSSDDLEQILFQIDADPKMVCTKPFADISKYSVISQEAEVLFMTGSTFRLERVDRNDDDDVWIIQMTLCNDDEHDLKQVFMYMKQQIESEEMNLRTLGKLLREMGKFGLAEKYVNRLLKELSPNDPLIHSLYEDLGKLAALKGEYNMSVEWHQKAIEFKNKAASNCGCKIERNKQSSVIKAIPRITHNTEWRQNGMTVAGGNGGGHKLNQLKWPYGLSIDSDQQSIYIADWFNDRIVEWKLNTKTGQVIAGGNGQGNQMNQLNGPRDVIVDKKNNSVLICDRRNRRVVEWSRQSGTTNGQILISNIDCCGITIGRNGYIYVSDTEKNEVRRWKRGKTTNGTIVAGGSEKGERLNQLFWPTNLFVGLDDSLYVSDSNNHRVMKWMKNAKSGIIVAGGQGQGDQLTQLSFPQGVIVDHLGNVYVADSCNHRIMCWPKGSKEGRIIVGGNGRGEQSNQLNDPDCISFDRENNLYVVDWNNHRVQKFEIDKY